MDSPDAAAEEFRAAWNSHHQRVRQYVGRRVAVDDVDELVASVFETAWRRWPDVPTDSTQLWWLLATAHRFVGNYYRGRGRRGRLLIRVGAVTREGSDDISLASIENVIVRDVLSTLTARDRDVLVLSVWDDLDTEAISLVLGITPSAAQKRLLRARERFKTLYQQFDGNMSAISDDRKLRG